MGIVTQEKEKSNRYLPHEMTTKVNAVKHRRQTKDIGFVVRRYHISKASYRVFIRLGYHQKIESTQKKSKHLGHYETPAELEERWQMDVKYVPKCA